MSLDWGSSSIEHARHAQSQAGWSDEELLARLLLVLRIGSTGDIRELRAPVGAAYAALPPDSSVTDRIELLTDRLPALSGPWATQGLSDLLREAGREPHPPEDRPRGTSVGWHSTSIEQARSVQREQGWTDRQLLDRLLRVVRIGPTYEISRARAQIRADYDALPADASTTDRIELLARRLPALSGPRADVLLEDLLVDESSSDFRGDRRRGLVIILTTVAVLFAISILVVGLRG